MGLGLEVGPSLTSALPIRRRPDFQRITSRRRCNAASEAGTRSVTPKVRFQRLPQRLLQDVVITHHITNSGSRFSGVEHHGRFTRIPVADKDGYASPAPPPKRPAPYGSAADAALMARNPHVRLAVGHTSGAGAACSITITVVLT